MKEKKPRKVRSFSQKKMSGAGSAAGGAGKPLVDTTTTCLATTWPEVQEAVAQAGVVVCTDAVDEMKSPAMDWVKYNAASINADASLNTAQHLFFSIRTGILVRISKGQVVTFLPFANRKYENTWAHKVVFQCGAKSVAEYAAMKAAATRTRPETMLPLESWWLNAGIACNVMHKDVWSADHNPELLDMLTATAAAATAAGRPLPDAVFFLNKRDYPVLRRDGRSPYCRFVGDGTDAGSSRAGAFLPIFSFYVGHDMADYPMPLVDDWVACSAAADWARLREEHPWETRRPAVVFRGSGTGTARRRLVSMDLDPLLFDVGLTRINFRDRVAYDALGDKVYVHWASAEDSTMPLVPSMTLQDQARAYRFILYMDGHSAASRYGTLMYTGCVILRVCSEQEQDCGLVWLFTMGSLKGAVLGDAASTWAAADHVLISSDLSNLVDTVKWLTTEEGSRMASLVAANAVSRAPSKDTITGYWDTCLRQVHATCASPEMPGKAWWGVADRRYSTLPIP